MNKTPYTPTGRRYDQRKAGLEIVPVLLSLVVALVIVVVVGVLVNRAFHSVQDSLNRELHPSNTPTTVVR